MYNFPSRNLSICNVTGRSPKLLESDEDFQNGIILWDSSNSNCEISGRMSAVLGQGCLKIHVSKVLKLKNEKYAI